VGCLVRLHCTAPGGDFFGREVSPGGFCDHIADLQDRVNVRRVPLGALQEIDKGSSCALTGHACLYWGAGAAAPATLAAIRPPSAFTQDSSTISTWVG
jgi:hypothetical protein